ncbi:MAG: response regulator transcription factor [Caldilineaceae bacterium]|nr:response regulator transcription factor [Caldilineaceae bacterium]
MPDLHPIRILLVDDQRLMRDGLRILLDLEPDLEVVGEADDGRTAVEIFPDLLPDVTLMDVRMTNMDGVEATRRILTRHPEARVIILTTFDDDEYVFEGIRAGAMGYLLKAVSAEELAAAIRTVAKGGALIEPSVARRVMAEFARLSHPSKQTQEKLLDPLSEREIEVLKLLAQGFANREIADRLYLAEGTVKNYVSSAMQKLSVRDRTQAALRARELGLLD